MIQKDFLEKLGKLFDDDAHFKSTSYVDAQRTFTAAERTTFLQHLWDLFGEEVIDFGSAEFIFALQRVEKKYDSIQDQAAHLPEALQFVREALKAKAAPALKVP